MVIASRATTKGDPPLLEDHPTVSLTTAAVLEITPSPAWRTDLAVSDKETVATVSGTTTTVVAKGEIPTLPLRRGPARRQKQRQSWRQLPQRSGSAMTPWSTGHNSKSSKQKKSSRASVPQGTIWIRETIDRQGGPGSTSSR